ncbi:MAG: choice-of-anchor D domain-containing protein [Pirellulales bacterium]
MVRDGLAVVIWLCVANLASSATVNVDLRVDPGGTYEVYLDSSLGDNFGIASYAVDLANIASLTHTAPRAGFAVNAAQEEGTAGFTGFRTPNNNPLLRASQDFEFTPHLIRGFGQEASSFAAKGLEFLGNPLTQTSWGYPLQIATGTWSGTMPSILTASANVFREATGTSIEAAVTPFPGGQPGIRVDRVGSSIPSGGSYDFGTTPFGIGVQRAIFISNTGTNTLQLGTPSISGPFSITGGFPSSLVSGGQASVSVVLDAATSGTFNESFSFGTNVPGLPTYSMQLSAEVLSQEESVPSIEVFRGSEMLMSGGAYDFGTAAQGAFRQRTFTITNPGLGELVLGSPALTGGYSLAGSFPSSIPYGQMANFTLAMDTSTLGPSPGSLSFSTNVAGQQSFDLQLTGEVIEAPPPPPEERGVTFLIQINPNNTFELYVRASEGDNYGIASYQVELANVTRLTHVAPRLGFALNANDEEGPVGFTQSRSPSNTNTNPPNPIVITASQDTSTPHLIRGFGQQDSSFAEEGLSDFGNPQSQVDWGEPLLLATGEWTVSPQLLSASVNVFTEAEGIATRSARVLNFVPEPSTITLATFAMLGLSVVVHRRRKQYGSAQT